MWILLGAEDSGGEGDNWSCKMCSSQNDIYSNTRTPFFTGQMPFLLPK